MPRFLGGKIETDRAPFLTQVGQIATRLPAGRPVINLCVDRRHFSAVFLAGASQASTNLLAPNESPGTIRQLSSAYGDAPVWDDQRVSAVLSTAMKGSDRFLVEPSQIAALNFTSGSTGQRTVHAKSWETLLQTAMLSSDSLMPVEPFSLLATVPAQHMYGLEFSVIIPLLRAAVVSAAHPRFPADIAAALAEMPEPRVLVSTPIHLHSLLRAGTKLPPIERILSATAPLERQVAESLEATLACPVHEVYGCTEAGSMATRRTVEGETWTPHAGSEVLVDTDDGKVRYRADHLPVEIELADFIEPDENSPRFRLNGRSSDLIKIGGKRGSLQELTQQLRDLAGVEDAVVFPAGDSADSRLAALAVAPALTRQAILSALSEQIDPVFMPRPLRLVASLPRDDVGKLSRLALRKALEQARGR